MLGLCKLGSVLIYIAYWTYTRPARLNIIFLFVNLSYLSMITGQKCCTFMIQWARRGVGWGVHKSFTSKCQDKAHMFCINFNLFNHIDFKIFIGQFQNLARRWSLLTKIKSRRTIQFKRSSITILCRPKTQNLLNFLKIVFKSGSFSKYNIFPMAGWGQYS